MNMCEVPAVGLVEPGNGLTLSPEAAQGAFRAGRDGVRAIFTTVDRKVDFIVFEDRTLAHVRSELGYPAFYRLWPARIERPIQAVLMDLDGTSVHSETFWIRVIQKTTAALLDDPRFQLHADDAPFVSGHSVSEHLQYCIAKYAPRHTVEEARATYLSIARSDMQDILQGRADRSAFVPAPGLKEFLLALKQRAIRIALVTSGLHEKAWPEIVAAFQTLGLGNPQDFYDAIVTAGFPIRGGAAGTLGELESKPHPWLYAEAARIGLGIPFRERHSVIGIEDSGAGAVSIRLAGFAAVGMAGGNLCRSGARPLLTRYCQAFTQVLDLIDGPGPPADREDERSASEQLPIAQSQPHQRRTAT